MPRFDPKSAGVSTVLEGTWACLKCSAVHRSSRALHVCDTCSSLPLRRAKVDAPPFYTSRYIDREDHSDFEEAASDATDSDLDDLGFCLMDEKRIAKIRQISEYGRLWTSKDTYAVNEQLYACILSMDTAPIAGVPSSMWSTIIATPISDKVNRAVINKQFHLGKGKQLEAILSKTVYAVQKNDSQLVCAFRLERCPHSVLGPKGASAFAQSFGGNIIPLSNKEDHAFDPLHPDKPFVCNTNETGGLCDKGLIEKVGLSLDIIGKSLRVQVQECIIRGLQLHATEYIEISQFDTRGTMSFHAGVSPREASQWRRKNRCGIVVPGLRKNSLRATPSFRNWLLHLELLISHSFLESFLSGTDRDRQGLPTRYRLKLLEDWRNYLGCPAEFASTLRIGGGLSLNAGAVCFHLNHLNDPRRG
jgi:hypothetical protein